MAAQVVALKGTFNGMFGIDPDDPTAVCIMFLIILLMEWAGGLNLGRDIFTKNCLQTFFCLTLCQYERK